MRVRGRRRWMTFDSPTGRVVVYVKRRVVHADGEECHAQYISGTPGIIEVEWNENEVVMKKNLFHEWIHVCFEGIGSTSWVKMFGECNFETANDREEELASYLEDKFFDLLTRNGFLRIPKPPKLAA